MSFGTELLTLLYRTAILYIVALAVFRLMGKRTLAKMGPFDFAVIIMIGEPMVDLYARNRMGCPPFFCMEPGTACPNRAAQNIVGAMGRTVQAATQWVSHLARHGRAGARKYGGHAGRAHYDGWLDCHSSNACAGRRGRLRGGAALSLVPVGGPRRAAFAVRARREQQADPDHRQRLRQHYP